MVRTAWEKKNYNGDRIGHRLIRCECGFFIRIHFRTTLFLLGELYNSAPLQAATLHTVSYYPSAYDVRWSTVYIAGGYTLISSRIYERMDVHCKNILKGCIYQRFPDVVDFNFDLVKVHWSISAIEPVVNHARNYYVLAVFEEELKESIVVPRRTELWGPFSIHFTAPKMNPSRRTTSFASAHVPAAPGPA